jgi:hypothetical protein
MATIKEELLVLGIKASCLNGRHIAVTIRQIAITCRRGTSVVRSLKFLTPSFIFLTTINIILSMNCSYVISPCNTNSFSLKFLTNFLLILGKICLFIKTTPLKRVVFSVFLIKNTRGFGNYIV